MAGAQRKLSEMRMEVRPDMACLVTEFILKLEHNLPEVSQSLN